VCRVHDHTEQIAAVRCLDRMMRLNPRIRLVVLDSVAFHFRQSFDSGNSKSKKKILSMHGQQLIRLASQRNAAVVVTNQVTTRIANGSSYHVPALGEPWSHMITHRVMLKKIWPSERVRVRSKASGKVSLVELRTAQIEKSASLGQDKAHFVVLQEGIRDVKTVAAEKEGPAQKRPRR